MLLFGRGRKEKIQKGCLHLTLMLRFFDAVQGDGSLPEVFLWGSTKHGKLGRAAEPGKKEICCPRSIGYLQRRYCVQRWLR